jgi:hypothetical protein
LFPSYYFVFIGYIIYRATILAVPAVVIVIPSIGIVASSPLDILTACPSASVIGAEGVPLAIKEPVTVQVPVVARIEIIVNP